MAKWYTLVRTDGGKEDPAERQSPAESQTVTEDEIAARQAARYEELLRPGRL